MTISIIAAIAENRAIGKNNNLLWHISEDLKYFKKLTTGHTIITGRKTFESFPVKPLPNRRNIILSKQKNYTHPKCETANSPEQALEMCKNENEIFIVGGANIYKEFLHKANKMYITHIHKTFNADVFFPKYDKSKWLLTSKSETKIDPKNGLLYNFEIYTTTTD